MKPQGKWTVVVVDEIGKMECFSSLFREALWEVLDSENLLLGSIAAKGGDFIQGIKNRKDVNLVRVTEENRDALVDKVLGTLGQGHD